MTIKDFTKLDYTEKVFVLKNMASLIDSYVDNGYLINIYSVSNFFVEATISPINEIIIDMVPYKRGFMVNKNYLDNQLRQNLFSYVMVA